MKRITRDELFDKVAEVLGDQIKQEINSDLNLIDNNTIRSNSVNAIVLETSEYNTIYSNELTSNGGWGICLAEESRESWQRTIGSITQRRSGTRRYAAHLRDSSGVLR